MIGDIQKILGADADGLLSHQCKTMAKENLHLPGPDFIDRVFAASDRPSRVLVNMQQLHGSGRLARTGYVSILPVDQGIAQQLAHGGRNVDPRIPIRRPGLEQDHGRIGLRQPRRHRAAGRAGPHHHVIRLHGFPRFVSRRARSTEIGRASCRERV